MATPMYLSFSQKFEESGDLLGLALLQREEGTPPAPAARAGRTVVQPNLLPGLAPAEGEGEGRL